MILNLLSNAVKYNSKNGNIIINCNYTENHLMRLSFTDTGAGISEEQQTHLFEPFNRLGLENKAIEGTGIGLVVTKKIVEHMGGRIGVDSILDKGSTFWIELPCTHIDSESDKKELVDDKIILDTAHAHTVLYIEDNPANLRLVQQAMMIFPNVVMYSAHEPLLGLELAIEHKPDLILLDINLPGMDGFEVLKKLQQDKFISNTPVIAVSADALDVDIKKALDVGFVEYMVKPINIDVLLETVRKTLLSVN